MTVGATMVGRLRTHWLAITVFVALSFIHTWPLATNPAVLSLNDNGDAQLNEWILAWVVHQLPHDPANLFEGNIFYPAKGSLAFSEPLIVPRSWPRQCSGSGALRSSPTTSSCWSVSR